MEEGKKRTIATEPTAMTYGMSDILLGSDLLQRISGLSTKDKRCLISYISEEVGAEEMEEDEWDQQKRHPTTPGQPDEKSEEIKRYKI